jgi:hypothetical protein
MDQLRARAYLHLLAGGTPCTLLTPPPANSTPSGGGPPGNGTPGNGTHGNSTGVNAAASGETGAPGPGLPALRGTVNLSTVTHLQTPRHQGWSGRVWPVGSPRSARIASNSFRRIL